MKNIIYTAVAFILILFATSLKAQRTGELIYFSSLPQASKYNPANHGDNKFYLSLPILNRLDLAFNTSGFTYKDLVNQHPLYKDSLQLDFYGFTDKLKQNNYIGIGLNTSLLGFGFSMNKVNHFSFDLSLNVESRLNFSKHLFNLLTEGTDSQEKQLSIFKDKLLDATSYLTASFGYARDINEKLTVGANLKLYFGLANINSKRTDVDIKFDGQQMSTISNIEINTANAFATWSMQSAFDDGDVEFGEVENVGGNLFKNKGLGIDLGARYKINDKMSVSASVVDLGYIKWKSNTVNIHSRHPNTRVEFSGAKTQYDNMGDDLDNYFSDLGDSLQYAFDLTTSDKGAYSTMLPTKIYIGYSFNFLPYMYVQALYKGRAIAGKFENSLTLAYSVKLGSILTASVANTFNSKAFNPQAFLSLKDIFYVGASFASSLDVSGMSGFSTYFGFNIAFKHKKEQKQEAESHEEISFLY